MSFPSFERDFVTRALRSSSAAYPLFSSVNSSVDLNGTFHHFTCGVKYFAEGGGYVAS